MKNFLLFSIDHSQATPAGGEARVRRVRFPWPETEPVLSLAEGILRKRRRGFREDGQANGGQANGASPTARGYTMKVIQLGVLVCFLIMAQLAVASPESEREAEKLFAAIGMEEAMTQSMSQMVDLQLSQMVDLQLLQNPAMEALLRSVIMEFFQKHMSWESLKPEFLKIYSEAFSAEELREINDFYATGTGRKTIKLMPSLMAQGGQIGAARLQANIGELEAMIKEAERRQKSSGQ